MTQVYVSIGNSDNKLTQQEWAQFCTVTISTLTGFSTETYGQWYSLPGKPYQNATFSAEVPDAQMDALRQRLGRLADLYRQDSIALQSGTAEFITPSTGGAE